MFCTKSAGQDLEQPALVEGDPARGELDGL